MTTGYFLPEVEDLDDPEPYGQPLTACAAERYLGIPASTVRTWRERGRIEDMGRDVFGRRLYYTADLLVVHHGRQVWADGKRRYRMRDIISLMEGT